MALTLTFPEGSALIAGGTGNVGQGVVQRMAEADVPTVFTYRGRVEKAQAMEKKLRDAGHRVWARHMDMGDSASIDAAIAFAEEVGGPLRSVLCPAGAPVPFNSIADFTPEEVEAFVRDDALAFFRLVHRTVPVLRKHGGGRIVLCTTMAARRAIELDGISPFSKGSVDALIRQIAAEEARNNITCNGVGIGVVVKQSTEELLAALPPDPGIDSRKVEDMFASIVHRCVGMARLGRIATPEEAGDVFTYLVSDQARYLTGQIVMLDGGSTL